MASRTFINDTGLTGMLSLLLLGILVPSVLSATSMPPNATNGMNGTAMSYTSSMSMIYCPSFMCNYTDCYMMYDSQNATSCIAWSFCQLMRQTDMSYVAGCVASCAESCVDASQTSCSVNCCNSTGCLNTTFASMNMMTTTTAGPTVATQSSTTMTTSMTKATQPSNPTDMTAPYTTPMSMIYCPSFMCNYTDCYMMYTSQNATSCALGCCQLMRQTDMSYVAGCVASCAESCVNTSQTSCSVNCCNSTGCLNATFASMMMITTTTAGPTAATQSSTTMTTSDMTAPYTTPMGMIYCPSFMCNYTDCYMMYDSQNATSCALGCCQLMRQTDMSYVAGCVASCAESCVNASQTNCSVNCCNSTGCLNATFASMMMTTTTDMARSSVAMTTTTTRLATTMMASSPPPTADNGKKCHQGTCTGSTCYTNFAQAALQTCSSAQPHCQLKKETVSSDMKWTAGCTANCSAEIPCKQSTTPPCHLECCNATMTSSCLWLNGTLNVPNFATRGPHLNTELGASLLCLLAIALLL